MSETPTSSAGGTYEDDAAVDLDTFQDLLDKLDKSTAINQYSRKEQTKKTNCPFRLKFIKKKTSNGHQSYFEFFEAIHRHNHELIISLPKVQSSRRCSNKEK